jgi:hypothetical protein
VSTTQPETRACIQPTSIIKEILAKEFAYAEGTEEAGIGK